MRTYNKDENSIYYNPEMREHFDFTLYARNNKETIYEKQRLSYAKLDDEKKNKRREQMRLYQANRRSKNKVKEEKTTEEVKK
jgi:hypothetical protein